MHVKMDENINDIVKIGTQDYTAATKLIKHFNDMIDRFIKVQSKLIDQIQALKARNIGYTEARSKCIKACQLYQTETCSKVDFDTGFNAKGTNGHDMPKFDDI